MACYFARGFDDFADAEAAAIAQVVDEFVALAQSVESEDVRAGEVATWM